MVYHVDRCYSVCPSPCFAGCGTRLPVILILFSFIPSMSCVCIHCKDSIPGCKGGDLCPTIADVNANAALFTTNAIGSVPKATNLFDPTNILSVPSNFIQNLISQIWV